MATGNANGTRTKTVLTETGRVEIEVTRDRDASFEPQIVKKRQRRLDGIDEIVLSLTSPRRTLRRVRLGVQTGVEHCPGCGFCRSSCQQSSW